MQVKLTEISDIRWHEHDTPKNGFALDSEGFKRLERMIEKTGLLTPVFVDRENYIVSGHYRYFAAATLKRSTVPTCVVEDLEEVKRIIGTCEVPKALREPQPC